MPTPARRPTVGVIIAAHDAAPFLSGTLASITAQSLAPDAVVVVDDASTDGTSDIARAWADRLPIDVLRSEVNQGAGASRATGIARLDTDLVAVVDADDAWFPDHLAHLVPLHQRHGGIVPAKALDWWPGRRLAPRAWRVPATQQLERLVERCYVFSGSLFARADYDAAGGFRDRPLVEDWDLWLRMAVRGAAVTEGRTPTVLYRRHTRNSTANRMATLEAGHALISELAQSHGLPADAVRRSLRSLRAEMSLQRGSELFESGQDVRARLAVLGAVRGRPKLKAGAVATFLAPRGVAQRMARRGYEDLPELEEAPAPPGG